VSWDPKAYLTFADERTRPAVELLARVPNEQPEHVVDLGCGPGNSTALLAARWPRASIEGVDPSDEMLVEARRSSSRVLWTTADVATWVPRAPFEVIFSNATFQWLKDHAILIPRLMEHVAPGGTLAFQIPRNFDAPSHVLMREVADNGPWSAKLASVRRMHIAEPDYYYGLLAAMSSSLDIWETNYLHVLDGDDPVYRWVSGTGLRPFADALAGKERDAFLDAYRERLSASYPSGKDGKTLFPFRRLFVVARK
jgi:trans-aconitate 2-methyltransferase